MRKQIHELISLYSGMLGYLNDKKQGKNFSYSSSKIDKFIFGMIQWLKDEELFDDFFDDDGMTDISHIKIQLSAWNEEMPYLLSAVRKLVHEHLKYFGVKEILPNFKIKKITHKQSKISLFYISIDSPCYVTKVLGRCNSIVSFTLLENGKHFFPFDHDISVGMFFSLREKSRILSTEIFLNKISEIISDLYHSMEEDMSASEFFKFISPADDPNLFDDAIKFSEIQRLKLNCFIFYCYIAKQSDFALSVALHVLSFLSPDFPKIYFRNSEMATLEDGIIFDYFRPKEEILRRVEERSHPDEQVAVQYQP